jgi:hypothetical protein
MNEVTMSCLHTLFVVLAFNKRQLLDSKVSKVTKTQKR